MANSRDSDHYKEYATVDTAPSGSELGYWTNEVCPRDKWKDGAPGKLYFSIRESDTDSSAASSTSVMTVTLQFKCDGDAGWQDYYNGGTAYVAGDRVLIEDTGAAVRYRAGVKDGDFTSGSLTFGFDW